ncbi:MAG: serine protease, partial [Planctomycetota bacterium]
ESPTAGLTMAMHVWRTDWGAMRAPDEYGAAPGLVLRTADVVDALTRTGQDSWQPASDPTRWRGAMTELYARAAPAIVIVRTKTGHGTGFLVDAEGHIVTNHHVIASGFAYGRGGRPTVQVHRGSLGKDGVMVLRREALTADVVAADRERDLALLRVRGAASALAGMKPLALAPAGPKPGQRCIMIGHPASGLLWSVRDGRIAGVGRMPHDIVDTLVTRLAVEGPRRQQFESQLSHVKSVRIALSSCQGNPGDSGGPLIDEEGRLLGVTFSIPRDVRKDKFVYHIHLDELRSFLERRPAPDAPAQPKVPDPWQTGPNVIIRQTAAGGSYDLLVAGGERPQQVFFDLDEDTEVADGSSGTAARLMSSRKFDAEVALHFLPDRRIAFYDTDNDGTFDLVLVDLDEDPEADVRFALKEGRWHVDTETSLPWLSTGYLGFLADNAARQSAMRKFKVLAR